MKIAFKRSLWMALFVLLIVGGWEVFTFPLLRGPHSAIWREALILHLSLLAMFVVGGAVGAFLGFLLLPAGCRLATWQLALISLAYVVLSAFVLPLSLSLSAGDGSVLLALLCLLILAALLAYGLGRWQSKVNASPGIAA
jgi:peptidoglycan/LPS O-acetylase OafA/YrhL